jgi:fimbrial isopeptide formation D2 family protein
LTVGAITGTSFTITGALPPGSTATVTFAVTINKPDSGDHQLDNFVVPTGTTPPTTCLPGDTTCTTHPISGLVVSKSAVPVSTTPVVEGQVITYTLTFDNSTGKAPADPVDHIDDLSRVLDDATVTTPPTLATGTGLTVGPIIGTAFRITGLVPPGSTATVTFAVTVNTPDTGDHQLDNFVVLTGTTPPTECQPPNIECTTHPVPALVVTKTANPASTTAVDEGQVVTYTLTFANTAGKAPAAVDHTDDLSRVLDDASVTAPPALATGTGLTVGAIKAGAFTVTGSVAAGSTVTVSYAVTVNTPDTGDRQLDNFVVPTGTTPPATCLPSNTTCTSHPVVGVLGSTTIPTTTPTPTSGPVVAAEPLARTGVQFAVARALKLAALLILTGLTTIVFARRRRMAR